ncbi:hypothetical protein CsSME_00043218 [Camellia sinensis var. sinensis]
MVMGYLELFSVHLMTSSIARQVLEFRGGTSQAEEAAVLIVLQGPSIFSILCSIAAWCHSTPVVGTLSLMASTLSSVAGSVHPWPAGGLAATIHGRQATGAFSSTVLDFGSQDYWLVTIYPGWDRMGP